jgi:Kef-type K+ transport system membrane component KefB
MAAYASGTALRLQLSPLFVCTVVGALLANLSRDRQRIYQTLQSWEQPVYLVFLLLGGAFLQFTTAWILPLALGYAGLRALGKVVGTYAATRLIGPGFPTPRRMGEGLVTQGGLSVAMALSGVLVYQGLPVRDGSEAMIFSVVVLGVVFSDLAGPFLTTDVLRRAGEISPRVEEALAQGDERGAQTAAIQHVPTGPTPDPVEPDPSASGPIDHE